VDAEARARLDSLLDGDSFRRGLRESLEAAVQLVDLLPWENALGLDADLYEAFVDVVEDLGKVELVAVRQTSEGRALVKLRAP
jgi:hypothetical protein